MFRPSKFLCWTGAVYLTFSVAHFSSTKYQIENPEPQGFPWQLEEAGAGKWMVDRWSDEEREKKRSIRGQWTLTQLLCSSISEEQVKKNRITESARKSTDLSCVLFTRKTRRFSRRWSDFWWEYKSRNSVALLSKASRLLKGWTHDLTWFWKTNYKPAVGCQTCQNYEQQKLG